MLSLFRKSNTRRRKQFNCLAAVPAQILEHKQLLSGVQAVVESPDQAQDTVAAESTSIVESPAVSVALNSAILNRQPTFPYQTNNIVAASFSIPAIAGTRLVQTLPAASTHTQPTPSVSPAALSPLVSQIRPLGALSNIATPMINPSGALAPHGTTAPTMTPDDHGNTISTATHVTSPSTTDGQLSMGDSDWFRLDVKRGQTYTISTELLTLHDSTLRIRDAHGNSLKFDDDGGPGFASKLTWTASDDSTIYIEVRAFRSTQTGTYRLHISDDSSSAGTNGPTAPIVNTVNQATVRTTVIRRYTYRIIWL